MARPNKVQSIIIERRNSIIKKLLHDGIRAVDIAKIFGITEAVISKMK